jgi:hypothetical protein
MAALIWVCDIGADVLIPFSQVWATWLRLNDDKCMISGRNAALLRGVLRQEHPAIGDKCLLLGGFGMP